MSLHDVCHCQCSYYTLIQVGNVMQTVTRAYFSMAVQIITVSETVPHTAWTGLDGYLRTRPRDTGYISASGCDCLAALVGFVRLQNKTRQINVTVSLLHIHNMTNEGIYHVTSRCTTLAKAAINQYS